MMEGSELEEGALVDKAKKSGISVGTLRKVYNRGMFLHGKQVMGQVYNTTTVGNDLRQCIYSQEEKRWSKSR